jgi:O-antigen/teichoic acid export membrane protein
MASVAEEPAHGPGIASEVRTAVKHSFVYGIGSVLTKAVGFLMLPVYTRYLSPTDYGILELLDLTMSVLGMLLSMGLSAAFLKYYGVAESSEEKKKIVSTYLFFTAGTGLLILATGLPLVRWGTHLILGPDISPTYLLLSLVFFVMGYIGTVPYTYARARGQSMRITTLDTLCGVLILALNIFFVVALKLSILGVLWSPIIGGAIKLAFWFRWMWRDVQFKVDWKQLRQLLTFGGPLVVSNLTMFILNFSDRLFLKHFQSLETVGVYGVGYKFGYLINFLVIQQFNMMWQARIYVIHQMPDYKRTFSQIFTFYSLVLIVAALGLALFSPEVVAVMVDPRYRAGAEVVPIVSLAYVLLGVGYYLQLGMYLVGRTPLVGLASTIAVVMNLVFNYFLIRSFGMMGAAWATLAGFGVLAWASYYLSERVCPLALGIGRVAKALALAIGVYMLARVVPMPSMGVALGLKSLLLAGFAFAVWAAGILSREELVTLGLLKKSALSATANLWNASRPGRD